MSVHSSRYRCRIIVLVSYHHIGVYSDQFCTLVSCLCCTIIQVSYQISVISLSLSWQQSQITIILVWCRYIRLVSSLCWTCIIMWVMHHHDIGLTWYQCRFIKYRFVSSVPYHFHISLYVYHHIALASMWYGSCIINILLVLHYLKIGILSSWNW